MTTDNRRLNYIDALRGIAILLVIFHHAHPYFAQINTYQVPEMLDILLQNGDKGVILFFVMSAFTLARSFDHKFILETAPVRNFFIRRIFRIVPLYLFIIALILLIGLRAPGPVSVAANVFFLHGLHPLWTNSTVPGGWSVGVEVLFYLLFPLVFLRIRSLPSAINATLISLVFAKLITAYMFRHPLISDGVLWGVYIYENIVSQLPVFFIGICLFYTIRRQLTDSERSSFALSGYGIGGLFLLHLLGGNVFKPHYLFALLFSVVAYALSVRPVVLLVNNFTIWTGRISYSLYLVHLVVANLLVRYHLNAYSTNAFADIGSRFALILAISLPIAALTYRLIELPFQTWGKDLINRIENKRNS